MIAEILIENSRGQVGQEDIYEGAHVYRFRVVPDGFLDDLCEISVPYHPWYSGYSDVNHLLYSGYSDVNHPWYSGYCDVNNDVYKPIQRL